MAVLLRKSGQRTVQGTGKADWQEVFSDGTDPPAQADTREEVGNKKVFSRHQEIPGSDPVTSYFLKIICHFMVWFV